MAGKVMLRDAPAIRPFRAEKVAPKAALPYSSRPRWGGGSLASAPRLLFPQPFTCGVTGCTAQCLLEEEAAGKAVCGGAALGRLSWAQQPAQLSCPCSQVQGQ